MPQSIFTFKAGGLSGGGLLYRGYESDAQYFAGASLGSILDGDPNNIAGGHELYDCMARQSATPPQNPILVFVLSGDSPPLQSAITTLLTESAFGDLTFQSADAVFGTDGNIGVWEWNTSSASPTLAIYNSSVAYEVTITYPDPPPPPATCEELGRETRAYVSAYDRSKVHQSRMYRFERRCLVANFNGAIPRLRTIVAATWRTDAPEVGVISNAQISALGRETMVMFASQLGGWANLRVDATLDNAEIYTQVFRINVREASWFFDDPPTQSGPFSLTVSV